MDIKEQSLELDQCKKALQGEIILCDSLRAENQSLKAENVRLQAIIDVANAQEPVGVFNGKFNVSINDKITFEVNCYDALPEAGARLYAASIPAQQSQRITRQDAREILESFWLGGFCFEYYGLAVIDQWFEKEGRDLLNKLNK